ncbi:MAG: hypothetical protein EWM73_02836 [Nitrospira sp.]|nr:MAG: hypothetical protein EWM73_02836 [Nitrospira sp.]
MRAECDILPDKAPKQRLHLAHHIVEIEHRGLQYLCTAECEKLSGQHRGPESALSHLFDLVTPFAV